MSNSAKKRKQMKKNFKRWVGEPLLHFLILGSGLFLLFYITGDKPRERPDEIVITAGHIDRLVEGWNRTWRRSPTQQELQGLIDNYITEEVLYREALALGLDEDDLVIRRRLRQKMEFITQDILKNSEATEEELEAFLENNPEKFRQNARVTFTHIYLSRDQRGEAIQNDAKVLLKELNVQNREVNSAAFGDPFQLPYQYQSLTKTEIGNLFGPEFANRLFEIRPEQWTGPVESGYGVHLVLVRERVEERMPRLAEVRETVRREWLSERCREANNAVIRELRERYTISVEMPGWAGDPVQISEALR